MTNKFLLTGIFFLLLFFSFGQSNKYNLPPNQYYKNAKISLKNFSKYEAKDLRILSDTISFFNKKTLTMNVLDLNKIEYFRIQVGNQSMKYAGYGSLIVCLIAIVNVYNIPQNQRINNSGGIVLGFTISGALIGGLIGLSVPKWKTYYLND